MTLDQTLTEDVRSHLVRTGEPISETSLAAAVRARVVADENELLQLVEVVRSELLGCGPLQALVTDHRVTDVLVNGAHGVYVDRGAGLEAVALDGLHSDAAVRRLACRLAAQARRRLDDAMPFVDGRLPGGIRLHAALYPIAGSGTTICLRMPNRQPFTVPELVAAGTIHPDLEPWLRAIVECRLTLLVTGGTGAGKTTVLATLLGLVDPKERLIIIEDTAELAPTHPHVVKLEARQANSEGSGVVTMQTLVRQALRMRPDRVVVGEVRGSEVTDLLAAFNTGHAGGAGTVHANSGADVVPRLEALALAAGLSREATHSQIAAGVDAVVHVHRDRAGVRRIESVEVLQRDRDGLVTPLTALHVDETVRSGLGLDRLEQLVSQRRW